MKWMTEALKEANKAFKMGEVPIGAVVTVGDRIVGRGHNMVEILDDATAHAEIIAIGAASKTTSSWRLDKATLYSTLEPCLMCAGAVDACRLGRLVYAAGDSRKGAFGSVIDVRTIDGFRTGLVVDYGIMVRESSDLLKAFFRKQRLTAVKQQPDERTDHP